MLRAESAYRERLARGREDLRFVHLAGDYDLIAARMAARHHEYMPVALLRSQFETLEPPGPEEALTLPIEAAPARLVADIVGAFGLTPARGA